MSAAWFDGLTAALVLIVVGLLIAWRLERQARRWAEWEAADLRHATRSLTEQRDAARQELRDARVGFARRMYGTTRRTSEVFDVEDGGL